MTDFEARAKEILEGEEVISGAIDLLKNESLTEVPQGIIDDLVRFGIDFEGERIAEVYFDVIDRVSEAVREELNKKIAETDDYQYFGEFVQDSRAAPHRDALMEAYIDVGTGETMGEVFLETVDLVSPEMRVKMIAQLVKTRQGDEHVVKVLAHGDSRPYHLGIAEELVKQGEWEVGLIAGLIKKAGKYLDDQSLLVLARGIQNAPE